MLCGLHTGRPNDSRPENLSLGRRLGQHFLFDPSILDRIVDALDPQPTDVVLEIGPGKGTLTRRLAPRVARVVAIERDRALATELRADPIPHVEIVADDALEVDWAALAGRAPFKVVGNIPYQITSPLIEKALALPAVTRFVFLMQKEVAERVAATPRSREYGSLSVGVQVVASVERLFNVRPGSFRPPPRVDSAVVRFQRLEVPLLEPDRRPGFRPFVTGLFGQRRKTLGRSLRVVLDASAERVVLVLRRADIPAGHRVEMLSPAELVRLYRALGD